VAAVAGAEVEGDGGVAGRERSESADVELVEAAT
jgi:hypothetical protein